MRPLREQAEKDLDEGVIVTTRPQEITAGKTSCGSSNPVPQPTRNLASPSCSLLQWVAESQGRSRLSDRGDDVRGIRASAVGVLFCFVSLTVFSDVRFVSEDRLPTARLPELQRALDASRGDEAAVNTWLTSGVDLNVTGIVKPVYRASVEELQIVYQALTRRTEMDWQPGVWF